MLVGNEEIEMLHDENEQAILEWIRRQKGHGPGQP